MVGQRMSIKRKILKRIHPWGYVKYDILRSAKGYRKKSLAQKYGEPIDCQKTHHIHVYLTFRCTNNCYFCANRLTVKKLPKYEEYDGQKWLDYFNRLYNILEINFQGGEPTVHEDFHYILNGLDGFNIIVFTNLNEANLWKVQNLKPGNNNIVLKCSYHPLEEKADVGTFVERIKSVPKGIICVPHIVKIPEVSYQVYKDAFLRCGVQLDQDEVIYQDLRNITDFQTVICDNHEKAFAPDMKVYPCVTHVLMQTEQYRTIDEYDFSPLKIKCGVYPKCGLYQPYKSIEYE